ncbi:dipeptidase [Phenylobacterium sp. J367]|uniref:dipeptidase n=1 Tax=Phenylobacterium sp. J367 TaxID=2898435 RepID=UPI002151F347|nr:dipeptidase [Phenylobacterium sp. J367]MCR5879921.1 dipeptidase [Phenylobacterium sp. J367]
MSRRIAALAVLLAATAAPALAQPKAAISKADRDLHENLTVLDTHFDTPALFNVEGWRIIDRHDVAKDGSQVDYPRMVEGGVDGGVFVVFTAQGPRTPEGNAAARDFALVRITEIREMAARYSDKFQVVTTAAEARKLANTPKKFVFISLENSYPLGRDLTLMETFYDLGARMMSPVHTANNDLADSATAPAEHGGLSPLGKQWVAEANRLGVLIDASHASDAATEQMIELSKAPIILSHTGAKAIFDHPRNIGDDLMRKLAAKGGVIQLNALSNYMITVPPNAERDAALRELNRKYGRPKTRAAMEAATAERAAILARYGTPRATFDDFVKHLLHAIEVAGIDHVGISGDFDGGGGLTGFEDILDFPDITAALRAKGYSKADIDKVWGGNALRVFEQAQAQAGR